MGDRSRVQLEMLGLLVDLSLLGQSSIPYFWEMTISTFEGVGFSNVWAGVVGDYKLEL